ncbi:MAG: L-fucose-proton symporter [SAR116 cluster bacterium]|jgi:fucose permease|nr:MAG: L-fucose-proton symporter [SAR116 cluster bacterium]
MHNNTPKNKRFYHIIGLVMGVFFVISFITNILNSIIVDVKESFNLSLTSTGFLPFTFFIAYGIMSIPAGFLSERYSERTLLSMSFLIMGVASLVFAIFPSYSVFGLTLFALGSCMAVLQVIINPMLRVAGGEEHFAFNSVLAQLVFGAASFLSPYLYKYIVNIDNTSIGNVAHILRGLVPKEIPWASLYVVFATLSFIFMVYVFLSKYPKFEKNEDEKIGNRNSYWNLLKNKWTLFYFFGIFCYVGTEQGIGNWISQFLYQYHGYDPKTIGAETVSYFWAMLTFGCVLGLLLLKVLDSRKILIFATLITVACLFFALLGDAETALIAFPMIGFFISVMYSIIFSLGLNSVREHHGSFSGILCSGIAGGAIFPFIVGGIGEITDLRTGMFFLLIPLIFITSIGFLSKPIVNNQIIKFNKSE